MSPGVRVAAVQPRLEVGAVERNLARAEALVRAAAVEHRPDVVVLPEALTSPNVYDRALRDVPRPVDGPTYRLLTGLARELGCTIAAGSLAVRGGDAYGTYVLAEPDGAVHLHDKDQPTAFEHNYYRGGDDDGVAATALGAVGLVSGWEWSRFRTAKRLRAARVRLVLGGMCWPTWPDWPPLRGRLERERGVFRDWARLTPGLLARLVGAPAVMASHVGDVEFATPMAPGVPWRAPLIGETQIVERDGSILARLKYEDGEGTIAADVELAEPEPLDPLRDRLWIPLAPAVLWAGWHPMNAHGRLKYEALKRLGRHPWQRRGDTGRDLPDHIPPSRPPPDADTSRPPADAVPAGSSSGQARPT